MCVHIAFRVIESEIGVRDGTGKRLKRNASSKTYCGIFPVLSTRKT